MGQPSSSLCIPCQSMCSSQSSLDRLFSSEGYKDHIAIPNLQKSAGKGCSLCTMLSDGRYLSSDKPVTTQVYEDPSSFRRNRKIMLRGKRTHERLMKGHDEGELKEVELWVDTSSPYNDVLLKSAEVIVKYKSKEEAEKYLEKLNLRHTWIKLMTLKAVVQRDTSNGTLGGKEIVLYDPDSSPAWSHVKGWLGECAEHTECKVLSPSELPRRVIKVGDDGEPLRLMETQGLKGQYVALSYCWGGPQKRVTDTSTVDAHLERLDETSLPQTIRDAIKVTRQLGFQYLWVDALCIVQDSDEDKTVEITRMHQYYQHASLTIVAANAAKAQEGFLRCMTSPSCMIPYFTEDDKEAVVRLEHSVYDPDSFDGNEKKSASAHIRNPISQRAWTLQETILSPRKLTYGAQRIDWECRHHRASMSGNDVQKDARSGTAKSDPPDFEFFGADHNPSEATMIRSWASVIGNYSSRFLTQPDDKLPAVSAIAQAFHRDSGWTYLAGLWAQSIAVDLLWYTNKDDPKRFEPDAATAEIYRAPSWSWAAMDGRIHMAEADVQLQVSRLVSQAIYLQDPRAPFGQVRQGSYIEVLGPIKRIERPIDVLESARSYFKFDRKPEQGSGGSFLWLCSRDYRLLPDDDHHGPGMGDTMRSLLEGSDREDVQEILQQDDIEREEFKNIKPEAAGLILVPALGAPDVYRRIGVFLALPQEFFDDVLEPSVVRII